VGDELFQIVTGTAFGNHDASWIRRHLPDDGSVRLSDVTSRWACFALWGPRARDILAPLTPDPLAFPFLSMREIAVGDVPVRALRVTFVGEAGWELYCPSEYGAGLWRTLWEAGEPHGMLAGGYRAIDSLRLEKGYRVWAADITPDESPFEAGLGFCVRDDKEFLGSDALARREPEHRLRCLILDDPRSVALGNEPVRVAGEVRGRVTSGGFGYTVERSIAYAYLPAAIEIGDAIEIDIFGQWIAGRVAEEPLYDPAGVRLREGGPPV
jgi:4-methylaminobutanoate oxidase (formaldehyde-forming)